MIDKREFVRGRLEKFYLSSVNGLVISSLYFPIIIENFVF